MIVPSQSEAELPEKLGEAVKPSNLLMAAAIMRQNQSQQPAVTPPMKAPHVARTRRK
jgi:hypothetical protein